MKVTVTGATGFVGRHVVAELAARGHEVTAVARSESKVRALPWFGEVPFIACDVFEDPAPLLATKPEILVHLAWPGIPNFKGMFHLERNLPADLRLVTQAVDAGVARIVAAGTCLEYGLQSGALTADMETRPTTPYGLAKDTLRKSLQLLQKTKPFGFQWVRLFYMYGEGQYDSALLVQLERAIAAKEPVFNMSRGDQLRDYLPIEQVAVCFRKAVENPQVAGVINCSSGRPVSVRELVEERCAALASDIRLNRGHYPYPDYEPLAFWGVPTFPPEK